MKLLVQIILLNIVISYGGIVFSAAEVIIRTKAEPSSPWVGQKVTLTIDVLAQDGWATIDTFPSIDVYGAYLHRYETQGTRLNETMGGASYSGQRYEVLLFAHKSGELTIDSFPVEVSIKTWGIDASIRSEKLSSEPLVLSISSPDGVNSGDYLPATSNLTAKQVWSSENKEFQTGDAIERTVTRKAENVSAMVFAPFEPVEVDGLSCYPGQPEVNDSFNRGFLTGARIDRVSCILERTGEFTLPEITVSYLNISEKKLDSVLLPGFTFSVVGSSEGLVSSAVTVSTEKDKRIWLLLAASGSLLCICLYYFREELLGIVQQRREEKHNSEQYLFGQVERAAQSGDKNTMLAAIMRWLDRLPEIQQPARLDEFARFSGDKELVSTLLELEQHQKWTIEQNLTLYGELEKGRKSYFRKSPKKDGEKTQLPPVGLLP